MLTVDKRRDLLMADFTGDVAAANRFNERVLVKELLKSMVVMTRREVFC